MKKVLALVAVAGLASIATAQTAIVRTTANGAASATIPLGGTATIAVTIAHNQFSVAGIQGGSIISGNAGTAGNFATSIPAGALVVLGSFSGGSRTGVDIAFTPPGFTGGFAVPPSGTNPMPVFTYDITGLAVGVYTINWVSPSTAPNVRLYATAGSTNFLETQSTYTGATITVIPAPASLALVGLGGLVAGRRRR